MQRAARAITMVPSSSRATPSIYRFKRDVLVVCIEINGTACGPTYLRCRKLFSTLPSSNLDKSQKILKRIPKDKRRVMVEAFVERYKADNAGKFPKAKYTKQQVGGSYYVIREILQMLQYEHKNSSKRETKECAQEKLEQHIESPLNVNEAHPKSCMHSSSTLVHSSDVQAGGVANKMEMDQSLLGKVMGASREPSVSAHLESLHGDQDPAQYGATSVEGTMPLSKICCQDLDACTSSKPDSKASEDDDSKELQQDVQEAPEPEPSRRVVSGELKREEEPKTTTVWSNLPKTTVWSNLKSLADNIVNFWRRT